MVTETGSGDPISSYVKSPNDSGWAEAMPTRLLKSKTKLQPALTRLPRKPLPWRSQMLFITGCSLSTKPKHDNLIFRKF
jgi:hypothetical protein